MTAARQCIAMVETRSSIGFHKGVERFVSGPLRRCSRHSTGDGVYCTQHEAIHQHQVAVNAARRAQREAQS